MKLHKIEGLKLPSQYQADFSKRICFIKKMPLSPQKHRIPPIHIQLVTTSTNTSIHGNNKRDNTLKMLPLSEEQKSILPKKSKLYKKNSQLEILTQRIDIINSTMESILPKVLHNTIMKLKITKINKPTKKSVMNNLISQIVRNTWKKSCQHEVLTDRRLAAIMDDLKCKLKNKRSSI